MSTRLLSLRPIVMADNMTPADEGPYFVGYGDDWQEFGTWDDAWLHHVMRGSTLGASHIRVRVAGTPSESPVDPDTGLPISGWGIDHDRSHPPAAGTPSEDTE